MHIYINICILMHYNEYLLIIKNNILLMKYCVINQTIGDNSGLQ